MNSIDLNNSLVMQHSIDPAMEAEYNLRARHPERKQIYEEFSKRSRLTRNCSSAKLDITYAPGSGKNTLDLFIPEDVVDPPLLVFIHGGYWRALDKHNFSFLADAYLEKGIAVALPNYDLVPDLTVAQIIEQVRSALLWLGKNGSHWGYDQNKIVVSGHSAGAHMAAQMIRHSLMSSMHHQLIGYVGISALFDLEPLLHASVNQDLCLTLEEAKRLSLYSGDDFLNIPLVLAVGGLETQGFKQQSAHFYSVLQSEGRRAANMLVPNRTHFDVLSDFAPYPTRSTKLFDAVLSLFYPH